MTLTIFAIMVTVVIPFGFIFVDLFVEMFREMKTVKVTNDEEPIMIPDGIEGGLTIKYVEIPEYNDDDPDDEPDDSISRFWEYDNGTYEWCFYGNHVHGFYVDRPDENGNVEVSIFPKEGTAYTEGIMMPKDRADAIIEDIEKNPDDYFLESFLDYKGDTVYSLCRHLEKMPFDINGIHATGTQYLETNGDWVDEYEDDIPDGYTPEYVKF